MAFEPTKKQEKAINANENMLVSAAAGSGKTAVLVERITRLLTMDKPVMANRVLIVTFTNSGAFSGASIVLLVVVFFVDILFVLLIYIISYFDVDDTTF